MAKSTFKDWMNKSSLNESKSKCKCDCGKVPCVECGGDHHKDELKESKESKECGKGKYWCMIDKKCKKIPKGWHVMKSGYLMKNKEHEEEEENKNGNGNGESSESNGGGVSESCGSTHETKKKKKKLSEMISTSSTGGKYRDISSKEEQEQLEKERNKRKKERSEKYKAHLEKLRGETREKGVRFYDKKGSGYIRDGKKVYDESYNLDEKCWKGYTQKGMKKKGDKVVPNCVPVEQYSDWRSELEEANKSGDYSLRDWFSKSRSSDGTPGWVQLGGKYAGKPCAKQPEQTTKPKCGSSKMKADLSDKEEERAFRRKNQEDPNPDRKGKAKNVATEEKDHEVSMAHKQLNKTIANAKQLKKDLGKKEKNIPAWVQAKITDTDHNMDAASGYLAKEAAGEKDACYSKVKSRYSVWPSAYASGALVKCRKVGAKNWGNKTKKESYEFSNWRDEFKATEYETIDIVKPEPMRGLSEGPSFEIGGGHKKAQKMGKIRNLSKGATGGEKDAAKAALKRLGGGISLPLADSIIHPGELKTEDYQKLQSTGNVFSIMLMWRGKTYRLQLFFSGPKRPSREEVKAEIQKFYPGGVLTHYYPSPSDPSQPIVVIQR